ncbi:MAG: InlB B-repeat-containing protein [Alphaproteobacteria bacterium]
MSIILISAPAFSYVTDSSQCDNDVLSTYTGPANLTANWTGNNISVTWYNGDTEYDSNQCTYGGELDVPTAPTKTGYTFRGWRVKQVAQCSLSGLDPSIEASWDATHTRWKSINPTSAFAYTMADIFGTENSSDLNNGEWALTFSYGTVKGMTKCSSTNGSYATPGTPSDTNGQNCWCQATNYTPNGGNQCNVASPSWVFSSEFVSSSACASICAYDCASRYGEDFRLALFGIAH